jgi:hypothetical protein
LDAALRSQWPFRFTMVDVSTSFNLLAITVGLFLARLQWARTQRPYLGFYIDDEGQRFDSQSDVWRVWLSNAGPGMAIVKKIEYRVSFYEEATGLGEPAWVDTHR